MDSDSVVEVLTTKADNGCQLYNAMDVTRTFRATKIGHALKTCGSAANADINTAQPSPVAQSLLQLIGECAGLAVVCSFCY